MALRTAFTDLVGCEVPIQLAPMGGICTPDLIAAVNAAGGMGALGAGFASAEELAKTIAEVRAKTAGPLLVNILMPFLDREAVATAAELATVVDFYHGAPDRSLVDLVHDHGTPAGWQVGSLAEAVAAVDAGCDVLVVRGVEGGGRMHGVESLWPLLIDVVEAVDVPVLAAGGIGTGRGVAAALTAGAAGVRMGTRFLASPEAGTHPAYRDEVIAAAAADSILSDEFRTGWPDEWSRARVLRSSLAAAQAFDGDVVGEAAVGDQTFPVPRFTFFPPFVGVEGAVATMPMYAGESVRFVTEVEPAGDIVRRIAADAERHLARAA